MEICGNNDEKIRSLKSMEIADDLYKEGVKELEAVICRIRMFGVPEKNFQVDLTIARGLDYYTGTVYETFLDDYKKLRKHMFRWKV